MIVGSAIGYLRGGSAKLTKRRHATRKDDFDGIGEIHFHLGIERRAMAGFP
jgi:hypothetical protein